MHSFGSPYITPPRAMQHPPSSLFMTRQHTWVTVSISWRSKVRVKTRDDNVPSVVWGVAPRLRTLPFPYLPLRTSISVTLRNIRVIHSLAPHYHHHLSLLSMFFYSLHACCLASLYCHIIPLLHQIFTSVPSFHYSSFMIGVPPL